MYNIHINIKEVATMEVFASSREFSAKELYVMTHNGDSLKNHPEGECFTITGWCDTESKNSKGDIKPIFVFEVKDIEGKIHYIATQSQTVKNSVMEMWELFAPEVEVVHRIGVTKLGREFHNVELVM